MLHVGSYTGRDCGGLTRRHLLQVGGLGLLGLGLPQLFRAAERDVYLYDRQAKKLLPTPGLNSKTEDFDPCVIVLP